ncbi:MAG: tetratricopeptide repeat protein [Myxococcaceae bacterium]|nr:tetratricopeptide repeat protein [Myxococcaceae bacterium]
MMWLVLLLSLAAPVADDVNRAKVHYQAGKTHYDLGNYSEAIREFAAGYALAPKPEFLINLGQAYRASGDLRTALDMYQRYLEKAPANAPQRAQVQGLMNDLRAELADSAPRKEPEPVAATEPAPAAAVPTQAEAVAVESKPTGTSPWVIVGVSAAVVAVVAGVVAGVVVATRRTPGCAGAEGLGCADLR